MALIAQWDISLVAVMALRTFDVAAIGYVVLVRIPLEILRPFRYSLDRFMAFKTCLPGGRRCGLGLRMTRLASEAPFLMAVRGKNTLFLDRSESGPNQSCDRSQAKYPLNQSKNSFLK
jgi:hypothetical protein